MLEVIRRAYPLVELFRAFKVGNTCKIGLLWPNADVM